MSEVVTGKVAFSNVTEHEVYKGRSTGKYSLVITLEADQAKILEDLGITLKDYEGTAQRKFASKYGVDVLDIEGNPYSGEIPRGSVVRVLFTLGNVSQEFGQLVYLNKVRVVEEAALTDDDDVPSDF